MNNWSKYFEDFLNIPRESGNEIAISNYLVSFAKSHNLEYYVDDIYNVIIKRPSNNGSDEVIILQGHTDMVCTSINNYDFKSNGIEYYIEDGFYKSKGTTLGADNGIGCALILSLLANKDLLLPNIEVIFTVQEETTMEGAKRLDYSKITGKKLISIDGTEEGVIEVSSAGMASIIVNKTLTTIPNNTDTYQIVINGMKGGHSGVDINKGRGNAIETMNNILKEIPDCHLCTISGGSKENVIPSDCSALITTHYKLDVHNFEHLLHKDAKLTIKKVEKCAKVFSKEDTDIIMDFIHNLPKGVLAYRDTFPQTSLNLGVIKTINNLINIEISIRSSDITLEEKYIKEVQKLSTSLEYTLLDRKPFFTFKEKSPLRQQLVNTYKKLYNKNVILEDVHAGLEGGLFAQHIEDIDICVIAPNLYDIHTINERVEIESVNRVYRWLVETLKDM